MKTLDQIRQTIRDNLDKQIEPYAGLDSSEIGRHSRALMWGAEDEAYPGEAEWASITD